jgi:uncharacterized protein (DUF2235 family)
MPKNIVIFSDGTGLRGGILVDERRSNIYKLYRASRCGPDSCVNPADQVAFYDPGIGTLPPGSGFIENLSRIIYNLVSQALGLGLTRNIIDCYAALIKLRRQGDRIFLFGFSRGAYTIRCLAAVIAKCGIPTQMHDGSGLRYDESAIKRIAKEAVKKVYQHTSSWVKKGATPRQLELLDQRDAMANRFREQYGSGDATGANVYPHFIGVFDTVASLSNPVALAILIACTPFVTAIFATLIYFVLYFFGFSISWLLLFLGLTVAVILIGWFLNFLHRIRVAFGLPGYPWHKTLHLTEARMNFYDRTLNPNVSFARHALAIDERRSSFQRVGWGEPGAASDATDQSFEQLWFAGDHSDVGGSNEENESRLSDISLEWILGAAIDAGFKYDPAFLHLFPDPAGPQHDEAKTSIFRFASKQPRRIPPDAPLHDSVLQRFGADEVLNCDRLEPYRPENLRHHVRVRHLYGEG